jgi:hypothetical protein
MNFGAVPELTLRQRLKLKISGYAFLRWVKPEGYLGAVALYVVQLPSAWVVFGLSAWFQWT